MKLFKTLLLLSLISISSLADETMIVPDRPGFSTGTHTVEVGRLNVELGYEYGFKMNSNELSTETLPLVVLRTGITSKIEIDIMSNEWNIDNTKQQISGFIVADLSIGGKYRLYESDLYNFTAMGMLSIPTDGSALISNNMDSFLAFLWDYTLSDEQGLFGTVQTTSTYDGTKRIYDIELAVGDTFSHTDKLASYIEIYSIVPFESNLDTEIVCDGGVTYMLSDNTQLDFNIGIGLNYASRDFIGFGIASRF